MDGSRFDRLARSVAYDVSRRQVLQGLGLGVLGAIVLPDRDVTANSGRETAKACQKGQYVSTWIKDDGSPFGSTGDCVSYVRTGGNQVAVQLTLSFVPTSDGGLVQFSGSGLEPLQTFRLVGVLADDSTEVIAGRPIDDQGERSLFQAGPVCGRGLTHIVAMAGPTGTTPLLDAYGNPISAEVEISC